MSYYSVLQAVTMRQMDNVARVRRQSFTIGDGGQLPSHAERDMYDDQPNCCSWLLVDDTNECVGTIRFCIYGPSFGWMGIPLRDVFPNEFERFEVSSTALVQSTFFAIVPEIRGPNLVPKLLLIREWFRVAVVHGIKSLVTIVENRRSLLRFYERLGFKTVGMPRVHPLAQRETALIGADTASALNTVRGNPSLQLIGDFDQGMRTLAH